ncbi:AMP-binding protein [Conexibacter stalactiti]|uniref:AMP-binding protein n=1 Tax=Conexibacter stalactiti TaxID=1940611 RepID=A0ABU4HR90_9ACTN|nr:AMP-binding protein [Conexibacter stalactiti]MDW5595798.1 AMP-binding protein [Conexibacter stalactiti]MEC5036440.1 AMP-binding protein [Conexibacter stalactiti]
MGEILTALAAAAPRLPAVTCGERTVTRAELESRANRLARAYAERGVGFGDLVTVALPNSIETFACFYALWKLGAVPQPVSWRLPPRELAQIVELADAPLVIGVGDGAAGGRPTLPAGFAPDPALSDAPLPPVTAPAWKAPTSGGSTGRPKLIVSGQSGAPDLDGLASVFRIGPRDVQLVPGPLYHNAPLTLSLLGSYLGQHVIVLERFDAEAALRAIERHRVTFVNFVPTMMLRILRLLDAQPGRWDLGSLETVWHMGGPCPPWLKERWIELVGAERLLELYGGTESQALTVIDGVEWRSRRGSVGRAVVGEVGVVDADGRPAAPGELGEVVLRRTPGTPPTYRYIGATAREFGDGWESLGDLGRLDADGYLYLADRKLDLVVAGGANVYPAEVEAVLDEHPQVLSCAVVGLPDDDLGERVHAVVQADGALDAEQLLAFAAERLVRYKLPRSVRFVSEPLRDDAGKVRRSAVRERELELIRTPTHEEVE